MQEMSIGQVIQKERMRKGISQESLCEGICEQGTLSRLENGKGNPSMRVVSSLLEKLELDGNRFYARLTPQEQKIENLCKEITSCNVRYQSAPAAERQAIRAESYAKIHALEKVIGKGDHITAQFILRSQAILDREDGEPYTLEEKLELLTMAIRLTVPRFDLEQFEKGHYTLTEMKILNQIALVYGNSGQREKAIALYRKLLEYVQSHCKNIQDVRNMIILIAHNYAGQLRMLERYQEAIQIGELGCRACMDYGHYQYLGGLLHTLGECYHFLGDDKKGIDCFFEAYFLYKAAGNENGVTLLQADADAYYGILKKLIAAASGFLG